MLSSDGRGVRSHSKQHNVLMFRRMRVHAKVQQQVEDRNRTLISRAEPAGRELFSMQSRRAHARPSLEPQANGMWVMGHNSMAQAGTGLMSSTFALRPNARDGMYMNPNACHAGSSCYTQDDHACQRNSRLCISADRRVIFKTINRVG